MQIVGFHRFGRFVGVRVGVVFENGDTQNYTTEISKARKNAIVEYLDYQIREMEICKQQSEIKVRHLPAVIQI